MNNIMGIYSGLSENAWYPNMIIVNIPKSNFNGVYNKHDKGGGGIIYLNKIKNKILKVKFFGFENDPEIKYQKLASIYSPEIFYESFRHIGCDISNRKAFDGAKVQIIIMEYLSLDKWIPLRSIQQLSVPHIQDKLFEIIYKFVFDFKIKNTADFIGKTGPHLFMNEKTKQIKIIDYGKYQDSVNNSHDFFAMVQDIQDVLMRWPNNELLTCYDKIKDLNKQVTDDKCKKLLLYKARLFLEKKHNIIKRQRKQRKHGKNSSKKVTRRITKKS